MEQQNSTTPVIGLKLSLTTPPQAPAAVVMSQVAKAPAEQQKALRFFDILDEDAQRKATATAQKDYPTLLHNNAALITYANEVFTNLNNLVERMKKEIPALNIPELNKLMNDLSADMRKLRLKWDTSDPKVKKWVEEHLDGVKDLIGRTRSLVEILMEDAMNIYQRMDRIKAFVASKRIDMQKNVHLLDQFYAANADELLNLIYVIAVQEEIQRLALEEADSLKPDPKKPGDPVGELKRITAEFATNMALRVQEFKNRACLAWSFAPQITTNRTLNLSMAIRLDLLENVTIPSVVFAIEQWKLAIQAQEAAQMVQQISQFSNDVLQAAAASGAQITTFVADVAQTPTLSPATIAKMAQSAEEQADALAVAYTTGRQRQLESDTALRDSVKVISGSEGKVTQAILNAYMKKAEDAEQFTATEHQKLEELTAGVPLAPDAVPAGTAPAEAA